MLQGLHCSCAALLMCKGVKRRINYCCMVVRCHCLSAACSAPLPSCHRAPAAVCVGFPCLMYAKVYQTSGGKLRLMQLVNLFMVGSIAVQCPSCWLMFNQLAANPCCRLLRRRRNSCALQAGRSRLLSLQPEAPLHPYLPQGLVALGALVGSARALVVEWSSGFQLFQ